jgi:hypothetical protein
MEALSSSETSVLTRATRRNIPENDLLHSHSSENLKSYKRILYRGGWCRSVHQTYTTNVLGSNLGRDAGYPQLGLP